MSEIGERAAMAVASHVRPEADWPADWRTVDLYQTFLNLERSTPPDQLSRTDGASLLKRGSIATLIAESGAGKSTLSAWFGLEQVRRGEGIAVFDFEDSESNYVNRLVALGFTRVEIVGQLRYFNPYSSFDEKALAAVLDELRPEPSLIVIDAATEAAVAAIPGASSNSNDDWARFMNTFVRPLRDHTGATILILDHPVKDRDSRGDYAAGTGHKRASVDVALGLEVVKPFGRGESGQALLKLFKDRNGHLRGLANDSNVLGEVNFECRSNGQMRVAIDPPDDRTGAFRPTTIMETVSRFVEGNAASTVRQIREAVTGNNRAVGVALDLLVAEGFIQLQVDGRKRLHTSIQPFREAENA
jgi:hypothetical protein